MAKHTSIPYIVTATIILIMLAATAILTTNPTRTTASKTPPSPNTISLPTPPPTCDYCTTDMLTMSPEEIGAYTVDYLRTAQEITNDTPEVLLSRIITRDDYSDLGLGCLPDYSSIEDAPLVLVILKGDLRYTGPSMVPILQDSHYAVIVMDMWAATATSESFSPGGEGLGKALNNPALTTNEPRQCGERAPRTLHYGQSAGGEIIPTSIPPATSTPADPIPYPQPTLDLPTP